MEVTAVLVVGGAQLFSNLKLVRSTLPTLYVARNSACYNARYLYRVRVNRILHTI